MEAKKVARMLNPTKVITGPRTRWSYANVWDPKSINGGDPKYSVSLIIPKSDTRTIAKIEAASPGQKMTLPRMTRMISSTKYNL